MNEKTLLNLAKATIQAYFEEKEVNTSLYERFNEPKGVFVTLTKNNTLRGCVGLITSDQPLYKTVKQMSIAAAFNDQRFPPLRKQELAEIHISLSILSIPEKINTYQEIIIGKHGVILKKGTYQAVFLPEVATEQQWTLKKFLEQLALKARLQASEWQSSELYIFTTKKLS